MVEVGCRCRYEIEIDEIEIDEALTLVNFLFMSVIGSFPYTKVENYPQRPHRYQ